MLVPALPDVLCGVWPCSPPLPAWGVRPSASPLSAGVCVGFALLSLLGVLSRLWCARCLAAPRSPPWCVVCVPWPRVFFRAWLCLRPLPAGLVLVACVLVPRLSWLVCAMCSLVLASLVWGVLSGPPCLGSFVWGSRCVSSCRSLPVPVLRCFTLAPASGGLCVWCVSPVLAHPSLLGCAVCALGLCLSCLGFAVCVRFLCPLARVCLVCPSFVPFVVGWLLGACVACGLSLLALLASLVLVFPTASKQGAQSRVAFKRAGWLYNPCRLGVPYRFKAGGKIRSGPPVGRVAT